ncbi:DUF7282 domain-containing protein [Roseovarius aestuarii]|uniref:DUF7282 domain-containing protein n=1 Tax=Roseovarius aestuarii TaxID=475083 RepID=A0A1X7BQW3_9RHOB|nr:hypothetical protein [Roseovarius aestuarii]SMC11988.1 hypothetical protein ROA7745_01809 [Roseovarius aestuarii]
MKITHAIAVLTLTAGSAFAAAHAVSPGVEASDQDVSNGIVSADMVAAAENGWLVVHRTDTDKKPGPVVGHAPLRAGMNNDVAAILTEEIKPGEMLMLMVHSEAGGTQTGIFEYTLGAKEDGPVKPDGNLVMQVITAQ